MSEAIVAKGRRVVVAKVGPYASDAGKLGLAVTRAELAQALGLPVSRPGRYGAALAAILPAVSQSRLSLVDGTSTRLDERVAGRAGAEMLLAGFGEGRVRRLWVDADAAQALAAGDEAVASAFADVLDEAGGRAGARAARLDRLREASAARAA